MSAGSIPVRAVEVGVRYVAVDVCGCPLDAVEEDPHTPNVDTARYVLANGEWRILLDWRRREVKVVRVSADDYVRDYLPRMGRCVHGGRP
jgi:hypothetical protein